MFCGLFYYVYLDTSWRSYPFEENTQSLIFKWDVSFHQIWQCFLGWWQNTTLCLEKIKTKILILIKKHGRVAVKHLSNSLDLVIFCDIMSLFTVIYLFIFTIINSGIEAKNLTNGIKALVNKRKDNFPQLILGEKVR